MMIRGGDLDLVAIEEEIQPLGLSVALETRIDNEGMTIGRKKA